MARKLFTLLVAALFFYIASPLLLPVIMGGIVAVLFIPLLERAEKHKVPTNLGAALLTIAISIVILVPIALMIFFVAKSGFQQLQILRQSPHNPGTGDWIDALIDTPKFRAVLVWVSRYFPASVASIADSAHDLVQGGVAKLAEWLGQFLTALPGLALALAVTTVSIFFFLVDGRNLILYFRRNSLFSTTQTEQLIHMLAGMCRSVILASIVSGLAQSMLMLATGISLSVPNAGLVAAAVFLASFVPVVGSAPITLGVAAYEFVTTGSTSGVIALVMFGVIATVDNLIRPLFLKGSANLHPLLAFVAAFGGLQTFGFMGVFLGPIIAGLFVATVQIMKDDTADARKA